jgi:hypothetical protein
MEPFPQSELVRCHKRALLLVPERPGELIGHVLARLAIERGTPGLPGGWVTPMVTCAIQRPSGRRVIDPSLFPRFLAIVRRVLC